MDIWLKTGYFGNRLCHMEMEEDMLRLVSEKDALQIPYKSILQFTLHGDTAEQKLFRLETKEGLYEGFFSHSEDARKLVDYLRAKTSMSISVDMKKGEELK